MMQNIGSQMSGSYIDKLDIYISIHLIQLLTASLFLTVDKRWIYGAVNLMHEAVTRPNVILSTDRWIMTQSGG